MAKTNPLSVFSNDESSTFAYNSLTNGQVRLALPSDQGIWSLQRFET